MWLARRQLKSAVADAEVPPGGEDEKIRISMAAQKAVKASPAAVDARVPPRRESKKILVSVSA
jgi:hypothetical protein